MTIALTTPHTLAMLAEMSGPHAESLGRMTLAPEVHHVDRMTEIAIAIGESCCLQAPKPENMTMVIAMEGVVTSQVQLLLLNRAHDDQSKHRFQLRSIGQVA